MKEGEREEEVLYESGMKPFALPDLKYELLNIFTVVMGAAGLAFLHYFFLVRFRVFERSLFAPFVSLGVLVLLALGVMLWGLTYYPRRVRVYADRIQLKMFFGVREIRREEIRAVRALTVDEARATFFRMEYANLSPGVDGAVLVERGRGRAWVFRPADLSAFLQAVKTLVREEEEGAGHGGEGKV